MCRERQAGVVPAQVEPLTRLSPAEFCFSAAQTLSPNPSSLRPLPAASLKEKAQSMATKAGVWIDHKQAIVVLITDAGKEIKKIAFDIGQPVRSAGGSRSKNKYTPNDFVAEDTLERKVENDRKDYYDDVIASHSRCRSASDPWSR